jgi:hypothetical protein
MFAAGFDVDVALGVVFCVVGLSFETRAARPSGAGWGSSRHPDSNAVNKIAGPK